MNQLIIYALLWMVYCTIHSILVSTGLKQLLGSPNWYRAAYIGFSIIALLPIFFYRISIPTQLLFETNVATKIPSIGLGYVAFIVFKQAIKVYKIKVFLGLAKNEESELVTAGILDRVRHPFYTGTIAVGLGFFLYSPTITNLIMVLVWFAYLPIGIWLEEKKLIKEFGKHYVEYRNRTPAVFPRFLKK